MFGFSICEMFCIYCCPPTITNITNNFAFMPQEPTYRFENDNKRKDNIRLVLTNRTSRWYFGCGLPMDDYDTYYCTTDRGNRIACLYIRATPHPNYTILYSHSNAEDIGFCPEFLMDLGHRTFCNVLAYDYSGYGVSSGHASESNIYADIDAAFNSLKTRYNARDDHIILFGVSIGGAPTIDLAARYRVRGVVIQSSFMSGLRLMLPRVKHSFSFDPFPNIDKISKVLSPVLIIHGTDDITVDLYHGKELFKHCKNPVQPLWIKKGGHMDLTCFPEFWKRVKLFIEDELTHN